MLRPVLVALVVALVGLTAAPSYAARWSAEDPAGDASGWRFDREDPPCAPPTEVDATQRGNVDITRIEVRHTRRVVRVKVSFADLDPETGQNISMHLATDAGAWMLDVNRWANPRGVFHTYDYFAPEPAWPTAEELAELEASGECAFGVMLTDSPCLVRRSVDTDLDTVRVAVPRECLGTPEQVRVGVGTYDFQQPRNPAKTWFISYSDEWGVREDAAPFLPGYSPWVRTP